MIDIYYGKIWKIDERGPFLDGIPISISAEHGDFP